MANRALPTGTVTFLFTDVEGSTRLLQELGGGYADALAEHRRVVREAVARHGGVEVDTQGDAFFFAFERASGALEAAAEAQERLSLPVRMGIHTGEAELKEEGYVGVEVHRAARICAAAHGGQVLVSETTRTLLAGTRLRNLGEHRLKDFDEAVALSQLGEAGFPPLRTLSNTNLPRPGSSFVGREKDVEDVAALLQDGARLLTLTGPGGSGKTRLAIEAAAELLPRVNAGVFWVGLAALRDPALVGATIAQTIGAKGELAQEIGDRELLLLLDNLEQVVDAAPELASLVERCPNLRLLVTSREVLRVRGEVEYPVPPLTDRDAMELFCSRSQLEADETIGELCLRLDNLPLAVELAAARTRVLSPAQIVERLSQRLDLLKGGRDAEARQRTLRATIEWSYALLEQEEQQLFARLAAFRGGCRLEAAEAVCDAGLDALQSLVDKSLVRHTGDRFWMLETIREYAGAQLDGSGDGDGIRRRHAEFFLSLAHSAHLTYEWTQNHPELVAGEVDNLRAAMSWARSPGEVELGLRIATALEMFWVFTNPLEGMRWLEALLDDRAVVSLEARANALRVYGSLANPAGDDAAAERAYEESLRVYETIGHQRGIADLLMRLGHSALYRGDVEAARELGTRSLEMCPRVDNPTTEALALGLVGETELRLGNEERGMKLIQQSAELAGEIGFDWQRTRMLRRLADRALERGDVAEATRVVKESLRLSRELGDRISIVFALARMARIAAKSQRPEWAGVLWGAVEAEEERGSLGAWSGERPRFAEPVLAHAGPEFDRGRERGRTLSLQAAVEEALANDDA